MVFFDEYAVKISFDKSVVPENIYVPYYDFHLNKYKE